MIERLIDIAADQMDVDPTELRRRNTIPPQAMPYKTPLTFTYDSGRFEENLDRTMKFANWTGFAPRRQEAARRGMLRGIGISNTIEQAADPTYETSEIRFDPLGGLRAFRVTQLPADHAGERCGDETEQQRHEGPEREITSTRAAMLNHHDHAPARTEQERHRDAVMNADLCVARIVHWPVRTREQERMSGHRSHIKRRA
jgi:hypothetical protein